MKWHENRGNEVAMGLYEPGATETLNVQALVRSYKGYDERCQDFPMAGLFMAELFFTREE